MGSDNVSNVSLANSRGHITDEVEVEDTRGGLQESSLKNS